MLKRCKTPGANFYFKSSNMGRNSRLECVITVPAPGALTIGRVQRLEKALHDAAEETMSKWWGKVVLPETKKREQEVKLALTQPSTFLRNR